jgi:hypothetical protein
MHQSMHQSLSYVHGAHDVPLIGETIGAFLAGIAERHGDNEALVVPHQGVRWTLHELDARVTRLAAGLLGLGCGRATGSGSGRRIARNGCWCSSPPHAPA